MKVCLENLWSKANTYGRHMPIWKTCYTPPSPGGYVIAIILRVSSNFGSSMDHPQKRYRRKCHTDGHDKVSYLGTLKITQVYITFLSSSTPVFKYLATKLGYTSKNLNKKFSQKTYICFFDSCLSLLLCWVCFLVQVELI